MQIGRRWLHDLLFADWGLKLLALAISLGLWFAVAGQRVPTTARLRKVLLSFVIPPDMEISNDPREEFELTLRGSKRALEAIRAGDVTLSYDASNYRPGERVVQLSAANLTLQLPDGMSREGMAIERVEPGSVPLRLERRIERELEVEPHVEGALAAGYELMSAQAAPARIRVRGPESHVSLLDKVRTESILLEGRAESFTATQVAIDIEDRKVVSLDPVVDVLVKISETQITKRLGGVAVRMAGGELSRAPLTVEVRGARSVIEALRAADLTVVFETVDGKGAPKPRLELPPPLAGRIELLSTNYSNQK